MPAATQKKVFAGSAYLAAARHCEQLAKVFALPRASYAPRLTAKQMEASLTRFKMAMPSELADVSALLKLLVVEVDEITESRIG